MKYLIISMLFSTGCGVSYRNYNDATCSAKYVSSMESQVRSEYAEKALTTEMCYSSEGVKYHHMIRDTTHSMSSCQEMPKVDEVRCVSNCSTKKIVCYVTHTDGFTVTDERVLGEKIILE